MTQGKKLLEMLGLGLAREERKAVERGTKRLEELGIPKADKIDHCCDELIRWTYDLGGEYEVQFSWEEEAEKLDIALIVLPDDCLCFDEISEGRRLTVQISLSEMAQAMPKASEREIFVLAWLHYVNNGLKEEIEREELKRKTLLEVDRSRKFLDRMKKEHVLD